MEEYKLWFFLSRVNVKLQWDEFIKCVYYGVWQNFDCKPMKIVKKQNVESSFIPRRGYTAKTFALIVRTKVYCTACLVVLQQT